MCRSGFPAVLAFCRTGLALWWRVRPRQWSRAEVGTRVPDTRATGRPPITYFLSTLVGTMWPQARVVAPRAYLAVMAFVPYWPLAVLAFTVMVLQPYWPSAVLASFPPS